MTKAIQLYPLKHGKVALVDDEDYERLNKRRWQYSVRAGYAVSNLRAGERPQNMRVQIRMHQAVLQASPEMEVDHISRDRLDNRRQNLRRGTRSQQMGNTKLNRRNTSGYRGVSKNRNGSTWKATIGVKAAQHKKLYLGNFATKEEAARAYNAAAIKHFGEFATLNDVPDEL